VAKGWRLTFEAHEDAGGHNEKCISTSHKRGPDLAGERLQSCWLIRRRFPKSMAQRKPGRMMCDSFQPSRKTPAKTRPGQKLKNANTNYCRIFSRPPRKTFGRFDPQGNDVPIFSSLPVLNQSRLDPSKPIAIWEIRPMIMENLTGVSS